MTAETVETTERTESSTTWLRVLGTGALAGLVAGVGMGLVVQFGTGAMALVGALYGQPTVFAGWLAHLVHSVAFGVVFAAIASNPLLAEYETSRAEIVGLGVGYGAGLGILTGGFVLPLALSAVGARELPVPLLPIPGVVGEFFFPLVLAVAHLVYGALLGWVYAIVAPAGMPDSGVGD